MLARDRVVDRRDVQTAGLKVLTARHEPMCGAAVTASAMHVLVASGSLRPVPQERNVLIVPLLGLLSQRGQMLGAPDIASSMHVLEA